MRQKRAKMSRYRGSHTHGGGHKKKRRGKGHQGGAGMGGTGARGDAKKPTILTKFGPSYFGKRGFTSIHKKKENVLSISFIETNFDKLVDKQIIVKEGNEFVFDSTLYKYDKILGRGNFTKKIKLICNEISAGAKEKVLAAGGTVEVLKADDFDEFEAEETQASEE